MSACDEGDGRPAAQEVCRLSIWRHEKHSANLMRESKPFRLRDGEYWFCPPIIIVMLILLNFLEPTNFIEFTSIMTRLAPQYHQELGQCYKYNNPTSQPRCHVSSICISPKLHQFWGELIFDFGIVNITSLPSSSSQSRCLLSAALKSILFSPPSLEDNTCSNAKTLYPKLSSRTWTMSYSQHPTSLNSFLQVQNLYTAQTSPILGRTVYSLPSSAVITSLILLTKKVPQPTGILLSSHWITSSSKGLAFNRPTCSLNTGSSSNACTRVIF
ncbi:hypothetical protein HID58_050895 [Brassica napus]|uniref:Uncharacterized protein n=1 Tax=Brassica napus TaxID=3708 RepID=A0ABQ8A7G9_BRANA|nr:hypothetical protein HID58_050895 [Brassica napus]